VVRVSGEVVNDPGRAAIPMVRLLYPLRKPRRTCGKLHLDVYDDKSGFDVTCDRGTIQPPTSLGSGAKRLRDIAEWLNEIADWTEDKASRSE